MACTHPDQKQNDMTYRFLMGSYTDSANQGIELLEFNPAKNQLDIQTIAAGVENPSFVIANKNGDLVYAVEETAGEEGGKVLVFERKENNENLNPIYSTNSQGNHPCHLALSPDEKFLIVSNYSGGNFTVFKALENGQLEQKQVIQHEGSSVNTDRQEGPHVHSATFDPTGKYLMIADLGRDVVATYSVDASSDQPVQHLIDNLMSPGDGPRHLAFSPDGKQVFVIQELTAILEVFDFSEGNLNSKQRLPLTSPDFEGNVGAAEIRVSTDGNHLYASNRGDANTLSIFSKQENGEFTLEEHLPSGGIMPRNFNLTPDGKYLIAAHQGSHDIVVFERDQKTGGLSSTPWSTKANKPVYLFALDTQ
ncbi:6-phosphogluconolactonase, cycloisomerase 2 family [Algoriphagus hitonicola]|uniref:6-phosphogluconolactonase, cycloisomerase 2 family n=2 Tax=Algoriphagus hitonicola TaxID=435880 RepID=A0A1I2XEW1_9BACT|nr:6-phosphogluconolactonase, cycloisomerase 2 family [Algoriphagus hitonicola]